MISPHMLAAGHVLAGLMAGPLLMPNHAAAACLAEPQVTVVVVTEHRPPVIRFSYSFAQLREFAVTAGYRGLHAPFGFYTGTFGYSVEIKDAEIGRPGCKQAVHVQVGMILDGRLIEIATDVPCRREAVLSHYQRHAEQDDTLLERYAGRALATFDRLSSVGLLGTRTQADVTEAVTDLVRTTMNGLLQSYEEDRERSLAAADNDAELHRLVAACSRET